MKLLILLLVTSFFAAGQATCAADNNDPDGVREHLAWKSCNPNDVIQPISITVTDPAGNNNYPIDVSKALLITAKSVNNGITYNKLLIDVDIYAWNKGLFAKTCTWNVVPTFHLLYNLDGCSIGKNCPLLPGPLTLEVSVDLSPYKAILQILLGNTPYKLHMRILNGDDSQHEEIMCLDVEAMIAKGSSSA